jgi:prepilin-type N-terminal cleavage/methylation domain-containing protein
LKTRVRDKGGPALQSPRPKGEGGFTLVEVMIALAIIGVTAVVLLQQRLEVVRDAARARDLRTAWVLASQKIAELELDPTLWTELGSHSNGDFADYDPVFSAFLWEYQIAREPIDLSDPTDPKSDKKPRELYKLTLTVMAPGVDEPILLEAEFPLPEAKPATSPASADPQQPSGAAPQSPADGGGIKK